MTRIWFSCFTTYQLFNALYYSMRVDWGTNCEKTLIWINDTQSHIDIDSFREYFDQVFHLDSLPSVSFFRRQITKCKNGGRLFKWSSLGKELRKEFNKNILICFSDQHYVSNKLINMFYSLNNHRIILVEEGVGTYVIEEKHKDRLTSIIASKIFGLHSQKYIGENSFIDTLIVKKPNEIPSIKVQGRKIIKQNNIFCDLEWTKYIIDRYLKEFSVDNSKYPRLLWIGDPLGGDYIDESSELKIIESIFKVLSKEYSVFVKKHPSEKNDRYTGVKNLFNVKEIEFGKYTWFPIEILINIINPKVIVTPMSSAAYNSYQTGFSGKIIYCYKLFGINECNDYFTMLSQKNNIYNVDSIKEIQTVLKKDIAPIIFESISNNDDISFLSNIVR